LVNGDLFTTIGIGPMLDEGPDLTRDRVLALAQHILAKNAVDQPLAADDRLTAAGLTSVDMVNLMLAVEAEFDITIPAADITPDNFRSVATIEALIARLTQH
jgi:acyl carrier protein